MESVGGGDTVSQRDSNGSKAFCAGLISGLNFLHIYFRGIRPPSDICFLTSALELIMKCKFELANLLRYFM